MKVKDNSQAVGGRARTQCRDLDATVEIPGPTIVVIIEAGVVKYLLFKTRTWPNGASSGGGGRLLKRLFGGSSQESGDGSGRRSVSGATGDGSVEGIRSSSSISGSVGGSGLSHIGSDGRRSSLVRSGSRSCLDKNC